MALIAVAMTSPTRCNALSTNGLGKASGRQRLPRGQFAYSELFHVVGSNTSLVPLETVPLAVSVAWFTKAATGMARRHHGAIPQRRTPAIHESPPTGNPHRRPTPRSRRAWSFSSAGRATAHSEREEGSGGKVSSRRGSRRAQQE
ncbi:hypothetical protein Acsp05_72040 [Actinokineospora sp. NBRC 105648]|nr:hypothetical protein Acsp05_72040 [Actinokineospora sp. NBRC 105648]